MSVDLLSASDFAEFFRVVHGHEPYPWQVRLTEQVLADERWPEVIHLPTGAGKTAVLDTAVFTLAARPTVFPRRVVFVIDRRIVVDQVFERARHISDAIRGAPNSDGGALLARIGDALARIASDADEPIGVSALRGGIPHDRDWATRPDQPWVMVSTIDQFGSKLLFRGYGTSAGMRPIHAGLAGNDCLVILDEVHLSRAFVATLRDLDDQASINSFQADVLPRRGFVVEMSATPGDDTRRRFALDLAADLEGTGEAQQRLQKIVRAAKQARIVGLSGRVPHVALPMEVLRIIKGELLDHERSVGIVVNRVRTAREMHRALEEAGHRAYLITGRMRPLDRERRLREIAELVNPDRRDPDRERAMVVATQSIEVGADFSFDALITEACPLDSLRQRLGRLDRRGTLAHRLGQPARCWVLGLKTDVEGKKPDPVYGNSVQATWRELRARAQDDTIDAGPDSPQLDDMPLEETTAPWQPAPLLLPTHMEAWAQTSPEPLVQPDIGDFLHGFDDNPPEPDVAVVWRRDRSSDALRLVPPRPAEQLSVPISAARAWLRGSDEAPVADVAIRAAPPPSRTSRAEPSATPVLRYVAGDDVVEPTSVDGIKPGDVLLVDTSVGGLVGGTWDPRQRTAGTAGGAADAQPQDSQPIADLGDEAQWAYGRRCTVRLDDQLDGRLRSWLGYDAPTMPRPIREDSGDDAYTDDELAPRERIRAWVEELLDHDAATAPQHLRWLVGDPSSASDSELGALRHFVNTHESEIELIIAKHDDTAKDLESPRMSDYYVLVQRSVDVLTLASGDDASLTGSGVLLSDHLSGVGQQAEEFAERLGLGPELRSDLRLAGELHDLGKVDRRFQSQLVGNDQVRLAMLDEPLAKSLPGVRRSSGGGPPVRHEVASVALAQSDDGLMGRAHDPDLVLHLVATHHGRGRPLPMIVADPCPTELSYEFDGMLLSAHSEFSETNLALEMADRFWRLSAKYGHHGLAWLEAILRLADHRRSAEEAEGHATSNGAAS